jgi:Flp pilus assembly protein TadG
MLSDNAPVSSVETSPTVLRSLSIRSATHEVPVILRRRTRDRRPGSAVVEFAVCLPFLLYLTVIGVDWARLLHYTVCIEAAARAGAAYASDMTTQSESRFTSTEDAAKKAAPNLIGPTMVVTETNVTIDGRPAKRVTVTKQFSTYTNFPGVPQNQTLTRFVEMRVFPVTPE